MKNTPGIAGKLFGTLGRSGISVIACAQGASETNISFVVNGRFLRKSLNVLHDSFFLSEYKVLNLFICGVGTVGGKLIEQIRSQYEELKQRNGLKLNVVGIASSKAGIYDRDGIDLSCYREMLKAPEAQGRNICDEVIGMNIAPPAATSRHSIRHSLSITSQSLRPTRLPHRATTTTIFA